MTAKRSTPPAGLGSAGRALWRAVAASFDLEAHERALLEVACRQADMVAALEALLAEEGMSVLGSSGQHRLNGAVPELRQSRLALARLLAELGLPADDEGKLPSPASARASRAAKSRWEQQRRREANALRAVGDGS